MESERATARQSRQKTESQRTRLAEAIANGRLYQTKMILADFTNLNYLDDEGLSPLMRAFMIEDEKQRTRRAMIKLLVHHKADVNLRNRDGLHVLNWACKMNKLDLVKLLLERCLQDVDLTSRDHEGNTPLIYAVTNDNLHMVKLLVNALKKFSLSVDHRNKEDKTAYLKALELGFIKCADILSQVGKASRDIKVNPFLEFLASPIVGSSRKIRVHSAPLAKGYGSTKDSKHFNNRNKRVKESLTDENLEYFSGNKKRSSRLFKSRKIHSISSQKVPGGDPRTVSEKTIQRHRKQSEKATNGGQNVKIFVENEVLDATPQQGGVLDENKPKKNLTATKTPTQASNSVFEKKDQLLRLLLDESHSKNTNAQQLPRSSVSHTSCSNIVTDQSRTIVSPSSSRQYDKPVTPTVNCYFTGDQTSRESHECRRTDFPNYHSYLVWKASLDHPPNTLRSFLALGAEQHSEMSSYRKGIFIPRYEPSSEDSVVERSVGGTSPTSERSSKSEAGRKISAVAKTVGLSIYLANKRKNSYRKEP